MKTIDWDRFTSENTEFAYPVRSNTQDRPFWKDSGLYDKLIVNKVTCGP